MENLIDIERGTVLTIEQILSLCPLVGTPEPDMVTVKNNGHEYYFTIETQEYEGIKGDIYCVCAGGTKT